MRGTAFGPQLHGLPGAVVISLISYLPFVYLPVAAQLRRLDPALEDGAAALAEPAPGVHAGGAAAIALAGVRGALLVGLHLLGEYGLFVLMRYDTFATAIVDQFESVYNGPAANLLGGVLVLCTAALIGLETLLRGDRRYARLGAGAARQSVRHKLGPWMMPAVALLAIVGLLSVGGDAGHAAALAVDRRRRHLAARPDRRGARPVAGLCAGWRRDHDAAGGADGVADGAGTGEGAAPARGVPPLCRGAAGIIVALALVSITVRVALPLYQTAATLVFAYVLMFLPRALTGLRSSMAQAPVELERAAMSLGRSPMAAVMQTTMRLAAPGVAASVALVALGVANELTGTLLLAPNGTRTLATKFWALTSELDYLSAAPYAVLMVVLSLPLTVLLRRQADRALTS